MRKSLQSVLGELDRLEKRIGGVQHVVFVTIHADANDNEIERRVSEYPLHPGECEPLFVIGRRFAELPR
jgi:hypothetical protein